MRWKNRGHELDECAEKLHSGKAYGEYYAGDMNEQENLVLYGAGRRCGWICEMLRDLSWDALTLVDSNSNKWGIAVAGYQVEPPEVLKRLRSIVLCITIADQTAAQSIREQLQMNLHSQLKSEINCYELLLYAFRQQPVLQKLTLPESRVEHKPRVLFDCTYVGLGLGGVESWTADICTALLQDGAVDARVIVPNGNCEVPQSLKEHIIYVDADPESPPTASLVFSALDVIEKNLPCKVVTRGVNALMLAACLIRECCPEQIEIISVVHGSSEAALTSHVAVKNYIGTFVGVSKDIRRELVARGIGEERVFQMQVPFSCKRALARAYTVGPHLPIRLGYAGRLSIMDKRTDLLLRLAEVLLEKNENFILEIAGAGEYETNVRTFIDEERMGGYVRVIGRLSREEIPSFWERQDICVNISDTEGRSISIIEAMGGGAVPVVTATSGVREDIEDGVNGYIVPLGDYRAMADRIEYLSAHRDRLPQMGGLAHERIYPKSLMGPHLDFWKELLLQ